MKADALFFPVLEGGLRDQTYPSLVSRLQAEIPVIIPTFNSPTYLRNMLQQLYELRCQNIFVVDNASTYPPMDDLLSDISGYVSVVRNDENRGARHVILDEKILTLLPPLFCVTDPDLQFNDELPSDFMAELVLLTEKHAVGKAGFSLDISERLELKDDGFLINGRQYGIREWERQFWETPLEPLAGGDPVYRAPIDTTFAVYNKKYFSPENMFEAVRVAGRYSCRHLPWEKRSIVPRAEESYYRKAATRFGNYHKQSNEYAEAVLDGLYRRRPDLQAAFPEAAKGNRSRLVNWAAQVSAGHWQDAEHETLRPYAKWFPELLTKPDAE